MKIIKICFVVNFFFITSILYPQANSFITNKKSLKYNKLSYHLNQIIKEAENNNIQGAIQTAKTYGLSPSNNEITVMIEVQNPDERDIIKNEIALKKGKVISHYKNIIKIKIPISHLKELNNINKIMRVREPLRFVPHTIDGEQVSLTGANVIQSMGYLGQGVKVAVIDAGFMYYQTAIANGELPGDVITYDFSGTGIDTDSEHGIAVAEVIYEIAPSCQLYLLKIADSVDLGNAKDYCIANSIDIINHSIGWVNSGWGDGNGIICDIANDANAHNILWVNSAGNSAQRHYQAGFNNKGDDTHNFDSTNINSLGIVTNGKKIEIFLSWNDPWGASGNDYDFYLRQKSGMSWVTVASSINEQNGNDDPTEAINFNVQTTAEYGVLIYKYSGVSKELQLFSFYQDYNFNTPSYSLMAPADASGVFTVGAIAYNNWQSGPLEDFSSRGPTQDGRLKPDICGVDGNMNFIYGRFFGTSSASPCIAGCAALKMGANWQMNNIAVKQYLTSSAIDMGVPGPDNEYGYGRVQLNPVNFASNLLRPKDSVALYNNFLNPHDPQKNNVYIYFRDPDNYNVKLYNLNGELLKEWETKFYYKGDNIQWDGKLNGHLVGGNMYIVKVKSSSYQKNYKVLVVK